MVLGGRGAVVHPVTQLWFPQTINLFCFVSDFIKFILKTVESHAQTVPNILKSILKTDFNTKISFSFNIQIPQ